uniref:Putative mitochondrial solute carrier protein n=1 Tax=Amblyomma cajennense TaxID=34607 RepID=A0A023FGX9_AMBCJ
MVAGAISGFVTRFLCQPFDVVKIRFQLQLDPIKATHPTAKYTGVWRGTLCILREEGVTAFWKGHVPAQLLSVVYGGVQFSSWEYLTRQFETGLGPERWQQWQNSVHFTCGFASGCLSTAVAHPFDVIRTRLVAQMEPKVQGFSAQGVRFGRYTGFVHCVRCILTQEGVQGYFKGYLPSALKAMATTSCYFASYEAACEMLRLRHALRASQKSGD